MISTERILSKKHESFHKFYEEVTYKWSYDVLITRNEINYNFNYLKNKFIINHEVQYVDDAKYIAESGIVIKGNKIISSSILDSLGYVSKSGILKHILYPFLIEYKKKEDEYFHLSGNMNYNFFHFLIDSLPRIIDYFELKKTNPNLKLLVNYKKGFTLQYLDLLGVNTDDICYTSRNLKLKRLYLSNNKFAQHKIDRYWAYHVYSKVYLRKLVDFLNKRNDFKRLKIRKRVYISRADIGTRVILNENEIIDRLKKLGFEKVILSDLKIFDQIELFLNTEFVIGAHGAGFSNLIFVNNCSIIEIFPPNRTFSTLTHMQQISQLNENKHILYESEIADSEQNLTVDLNLFEKLVENILLKMELQN